MTSTPPRPGFFSRLAQGARWAATPGRASAGQPPWFSDFWYGQPRSAVYGSAAGANVTPDSALTVGAVYRATLLIARDIAALPLFLVEPLPERENGKPGGKKRVRGDLDFVLNKKPNQRQTPFQYREMKFAHVLLRGDHYSRIVSGHRGYVTGLRPLSPARMRVERLDNDRDLFIYRDKKGEETRFTQDEIHHVRGFNPDPDDPCGLSVVGLAARSIGLALQTEEFGARQFSQTPRPSIALEIPGRIEPEERDVLSSSLREQWSGQDGWGGVPIAQNGMKITPIGMSHDDAQFLETRTFQIAEIARWFGVPLHMLSELSRATFSNIEHQSIEYVVHALLPWVALDEQCTERDMIPEDDDTEAEYVLDGLLRGDSLTRARVYQLLANMKAITPNEVRHRENMNPVEWGDEPLEPQGAAPSQNAEDPMRDDSPPAPKQDDDDAAAANPVNRMAAIYTNGNGNT